MQFIKLLLFFMQSISITAWQENKQNAKGENEAEIWRIYFECSLAMIKHAIKNVYELRITLVQTPSLNHLQSSRSLPH